MSDLEFSDSEDEQCNGEQGLLFNKATHHVQHIHQHISQTDLLKLYAYYKQATVGKCSTSKPGLFQMQARAKWQAWMELGEMSAEQAKQAYVEKVKQVDGDWYENIMSELQRNENTTKVGWVVHSTLQQSNDSTEQIADENKTAFDWVRDGDLGGLQQYLKEHKAQITDLLQQHDESGLALLHWATDRNNVQILEYLLDCGADVNLRDSEQQTALHYAATCGHRESIEILMKHGADCEVCDADGQNCLDVADAEIRHFIETFM